MCCLQQGWVTRRTKTYFIQTREVTPTPPPCTRILLCLFANAVCVCIISLENKKISKNHCLTQTPPLKEKKKVCL